MINGNRETANGKRENNFTLSSPPSLRHSMFDISHFLTHFVTTSDLPIVYCLLVYSVLKLFTGFATAALKAWKLMVITAINMASNPDMAKIHQLISVLYAKSASHLCIKYQATGAAIKNDINTSFKNSFDNRLMMFDTEAPITLRMPISRVRCMVL